MKIFSAEQIRNWDKATIETQKISSVDLMERAAVAASNWIMQKFGDENLNVKIFCGKGNNGGDGLAIARLIVSFYKTVSVYILETGKPGSADFQTNLKRLHQQTTDIHFLQERNSFPAINSNDLIIDALFGTGINQKSSGLAKELITHINTFNATVVSIDLPSGMFPDESSASARVIRATFTLSFQSYKLAFLVDENSKYFGKIEILDIGLDDNFLNKNDAPFQLIDQEIIRAIYRPRHAFTHKGDYGHALLITGSYGMMGASILAARACLRSGVGKLDCQIPACGYEIMQQAAPEAMSVVNGIQNLNSFIPSKKYAAIGVGPGIGRFTENGRLLSELFSRADVPLVVDADALYALSQEPERLKKLPAGSVLTPHGYEFQRLFGEAENDFDRIKLAKEKAAMLNCYIALKGHHTLVVTPQGQAYFNSTGNAGMATGGSGDVLTGVITGLMSHGYPALEATLLGVYIHGLAGDIAAKKLSMESLIASDIIENLGEAFLKISE